MSEQVAEVRRQLETSHKAAIAAMEEESWRPVAALSQSSMSIEETEASMKALETELEAQAAGFRQQIHETALKVRATVLKEGALAQEAALKALKAQLDSEAAATVADLESRLETAIQEASVARRELAAAESHRTAAESMGEAPTFSGTGSSPSHTERASGLEEKLSTAQESLERQQTLLEAQNVEIQSLRDELAAAAQIKEASDFNVVEPAFINEPGTDDNNTSASASLVPEYDEAFVLSLRAEIQSLQQKNALLCSEHDDVVRQLNDVDNARAAELSAVRAQFHEVEAAAQLRHEEATSQIEAALKDAQASRDELSELRESASASEAAAVALREELQEVKECSLKDTGILQVLREELDATTNQAKTDAKEMDALHEKLRGQVELVATAENNAKAAKQAVSLAVVDLRGLLQASALTLKAIDCAAVEFDAMVSEKIDDNAHESGLRANADLILGFINGETNIGDLYFVKDREEQNVVVSDIDTTHHGTGGVPSEVFEAATDYSTRAVATLMSKARELFAALSQQQRTETCQDAARAEEVAHRARVEEMNAQLEMLHKEVIESEQERDTFAHDAAQLRQRECKSRDQLEILVNRIDEAQTEADRVAKQDQVARGVVDGLKASISALQAEQAELEANNASERLWHAEALSVSRSLVASFEHDTEIAAEAANQATQHAEKAKEVEENLAEAVSALRHEHAELQAAMERSRADEMAAAMQLQDQLEPRARTESGASEAQVTRKPLGVPDDAGGASNKASTLPLLMQQISALLAAFERAERLPFVQRYDAVEDPPDGTSDSVPFSDVLITIEKARDESFSDTDDDAMCQLGIVANASDSDIDRVGTDTFDAPARMDLRQRLSELHDRLLRLMSMLPINVHRPLHEAYEQLLQGSSAPHDAAVPGNAGKSDESVGGDEEQSWEAADGAEAWSAEDPSKIWGLPDKNTVGAVDEGECKDNSGRVRISIGMASLATPDFALDSAAVVAAIK